MHAEAQAAYAAVIVTFLGAVHWGLAMANYSGVLSTSITSHLLVAMVFGTSFSHSVNCLAFGPKVGCSVHNCQEGKPVISAHTPNFWVFLLGICFHRRSILFSMLQTHTF